jgi:tRNA dimethylallyltransferase
VNNSKYQFISIIGQTATGKTDKAFELAELWCKKNPEAKVTVISADSKQVYKELAILTGADVPESFILNKTKKEKNNSSFEKNNKTSNNTQNLEYPFFSHPTLSISLHGTSILTGNQDWSVGNFHKLTTKLVKNSPTDLFIMVGGTGLYHQQIYSPAETMGVPPNLELRKKLEEKNLEELQEILKIKNSEKLTPMNNSDKNNPRRLIRAIEIANSTQEFKEIEKNSDNKNNSTAFARSNPKTKPLLQLGLTTTDIEEKIHQRVLKRLEQGVVEEVLEFEKKYPNLDKDNSDNKPNIIAKSALGYKEIILFIKKEISEEQLIKLWTTAELQYAKRQTTWWKKRSGVEWVDTASISIPEIIANIEV